MKMATRVFLAARCTTHKKRGGRDFGSMEEKNVGAGVPSRNRPPASPAASAGKFKEGRADAAARKDVSGWSLEGRVPGIASSRAGMIREGGDSSRITCTKNSSCASVHTPPSSSRSGIAGVPPHTGRLMESRAKTKFLGMRNATRVQQRRPLVPRLYPVRCIVLRYGCPAAAPGHISQYDMMPRLEGSGSTKRLVIGDS